MKADEVAPLHMGACALPCAGSAVYSFGEFFDHLACDGRKIVRLA